MRRVAALYVDPRGPYPSMPDVDCWDEQRDARNYAGPHPIVAHPPCGPWGSLAKYCAQQSRELAPLAVEQVRRWGGVLEHPAHSGLWRHLGLPRPGELPDLRGGICLQVRQVDFDHVATKLTWLYIVGLPPGARVPRREQRKATHWISGTRKPRSDGGGVLPPGMKFCSAEQRRRTPPAFAEFLVGLARQCTAPGCLQGAIP